MTKCLERKWNGETFNQLRRLGFLGFTHFYIDKVEKLDKSVISTLMILDSNCEDLCIPSLISACWKVLKKPENSEVLLYLNETCTDEKYVRASAIMTKELEDKWDGSTFLELKGKSYNGFTHFFISIMLPVPDSGDESDSDDKIDFSRKNSLLELIKIDEEYGASYEETISGSWKYLVENESLLLSLLENTEVVYAKATKILYKKFGKKWNGKTSRFTFEYLNRSVDKRMLTSSADLSDVEELARIDLDKGTTITNLIFICCSLCPKTDVIKKMIEIGKERVAQNQSRYKTVQEMAAHVFYSRTECGFNCLLSLLSFPVRNWNEFHKFYSYDDKPMMREMEESSFFLIQFADDNNLNMKSILNAATEDGSTLISYASKFAPSLTYALLEFGINANSVTAKFGTPIFRVRFKRLSDNNIF